MLNNETNDVGARRECGLALLRAGRFDLVCIITMLLRGVPCYFSDPAYSVLASRQRISFDAHTGGLIVNEANSSLCLTAMPQSPSPSTVVFSTCEASLAGQQWQPVDNSTGVVLQSGDGKLAFASRGFRSNLRVWLVPGKRSSSSTSRQAPVPNGLWWDTAHSVLRVSPSSSFNHVAGNNLCLDWGLEPVRPCDASSPSHEMPFCDPTRPLDLRVEDLVSRLSDSEVLQLINANAARGIDRLWIQPYNWWSEALHGVQAGCAESEVK